MESFILAAASTTPSQAGRTWIYFLFVFAVYGYVFIVSNSSIFIILAVLKLEFVILF